MVVAGTEVKHRVFDHDADASASSAGHAKSLSASKEVDSAPKPSAKLLKRAPSKPAKKLTKIKHAKQAEKQDEAKPHLRIKQSKKQALVMDSVPKKKLVHKAGKLIPEVPSGFDHELTGILSGRTSKEESPAPEKEFKENAPVASKSADNESTKEQEQEADILTMEKELLKGEVMAKKQQSEDAVLSDLPTADDVDAEEHDDLVAALSDDQMDTVDRIEQNLHA